MIGKNPLTFDVNDFIKGMSTSDNLPDGGFSPNSTGVNLAVSPGVVYGPAATVTITTAPTNKIIAAAPDPVYLGTPSGSRYKFLDEDGAFYSFDSTATGLSKKVTASSDKVTQGTTDFVAWRNDAGTFWYATTKSGANGDIMRWNGDSGGGALIEDWWTNAAYCNQAALSSTTPWRPMLVYERHLFIGDGNKLHRVAPDGTVSNGLLVFEPNENISALGIDKGTGDMLIAVNPGANAAASRNTGTFIRLYDGFSNKVSRSVPMRGVVTCFKNLDDATRVFYDNNLGIFTGAGVRFLRKLEFATGDGDLLVYPHRATVIGNTLYFFENKDIIAYGEVRGNSAKVFYPLWRNSGTTANAGNRCLIGIDDYKLGIGYDTGSSSYGLITLDTTSTTSAVLSIRSNRLSFNRPIKIREVYIELDGVVANNTTVGTFTVRSNPTSNNSSNSDWSFSIVNSSGIDSACIVKTFPANDVSYRFFQMLIDFSAVVGLRRVVINYDTE